MAMILRIIFCELGCFIKQLLKLLFFLPLTMSLENMSIGEFFSKAEKSLADKLSEMGCLPQIVNPDQFVS